MCPSCNPQIFTKQRDGPNHISPRFGACNRWEVSFNDHFYTNVYEAKAGERGWIWYTLDDPCSCGSGQQDMSTGTGKVELYHPQHPTKVVFDDDSYLIISCPEMHLGPYSLKKQSPLSEALAELNEAAEDLKNLLSPKE